jgi:hypothetical protein
MLGCHEFQTLRSDTRLRDGGANHLVLFAVYDEEPGIRPPFHKRFEEGKRLIPQVPGANRADIAKCKRSCGAHRLWPKALKIGAGGYDGNGRHAALQIIEAREHFRRGVRQRYDMVGGKQKASLQ